MWSTKQHGEQSLVRVEAAREAMDQTRRSRLIGWLTQIHPATQWIETPATHKS
jgi:hypothetical protein